MYSKETHFVLELIQNADDNAYDDGVTPALEFLVENDRIVVNNNEKGFIKEDVRVSTDALIYFLLLSAFLHVFFCLKITQYNIQYSFYTN